MTQATDLTCSRCGARLSAQDLACPNGGVLLHGARLQQLAGEAQWQESLNPAQAAAIWNECLRLLPADSQQSAIIRARIDELRRRAPRARDTAAVSLEEAPGPGDPEPASRAILKTVVSMAISIAIYTWFADWQFAVGLVGLILVHEMGHVIANWHYGLRAGPPIFIPFLGAVINLKQRPANAKVEAVVGIGGPVLGTVGALVCYAMYLQWQNGVLLLMAHFGFFLNLFNLLPVPPLDGGRVTAAISPKIWIIGLVMMGLLIFDDIRRGRDVTILLLILVFAAPRIIATLKTGGRSGPYYDIPKSESYAIAASYLLLLALLAGAYYITSRQLSPIL